MAKISKRSVDALHPAKDKDVFLWDAGDGALKGFGVRLKPSGIGSYLVQYRNLEGRTRRLVVGRIGVLTPEQARDEARQRLAEVARGCDPAEDRRAARTNLSLAELAEWYLREAKEWLKPTSYSLAQSCFNAHILPLLGHRAVAGLTRTDLEKMQLEIADGKTAKVRPTRGRSGMVTGGKVVAARSVTILGTALEFAKRNKLVSENVARGIRKYPTKKMRRFLSHEEIKRLGHAINAELSRPGGSIGADAIATLLLTGCRRNEILSLPWSWVDSQGLCLRFGDTKSGAQLRPIGQAAAELLEVRRTVRKGEWVFPSEKGNGHFIGLPRVLKRLCTNASLDDVTIHGLRHTYAAVAAEIGFSELTIAGLLGHTLPGITARYAHVPDRALQMAANSVSATIAQTLGLPLMNAHDGNKATTKLAA